jgi:hypothetical protein
MVYVNGASEDTEAPFGGYKNIRSCDSLGLMSAEINLNQQERI